MREPPTIPRGLRGLKRRVARISLAIKLTAVGTLVTAAVVLVAFWALSMETRATTRRLFAEELGRHQRTLLQLQRQNLAQLISSAAIITQSPTLRSALATSRVEANAGGAPRADLIHTVERELGKLVTRVDRDLLLVTDDHGRVFAAAVREGKPPAHGGDLSRMAAVRQALDPRASADSGALAVYRDGHVNYQLAVYPLVLDGYAIGTLMLGERLDQGLVASARAAFDGEIIITSGRTVLAGTLTKPDTALVDALLATNRSAGDAPLVRVNGEELVVAPLDLGETQTGVPVSLWLMQPVDRTVKALTQPLRGNFVVFGAIAVIIAALSAGLAARSVLSPFHSFVAYMRSGADEERTPHAFDARAVPIEVRDLNDSFDQLMESIAAKRLEIVQRSDDLAAANAVLLDEVRERQRVQHALRDSEEQLRQSQKLEAVGTLAGGIAHDFNNLLTAVSGFTQLALMNSDPKGPATADLRHVLEAADRAAHLTKQLLAFSRKQVLKPTVLDIGEVIRGVAPLLERLLGEQTILRIESGDGIPRVLADRGQLEQVIINLAINARDAMASGGVLTISTGAARATENGAQAGRAARVSLAISDTGSGIPEAIRDRIFEPFFTTKEPGKGTGLGLSTVYGIVKQSGGTIDFETKLGAGTTFSITLPATSEADVPGVVRETSDLPGGTETILLVEDDADVLEFAKRSLEQRGYTVHAAGDAMEALTIAKQISFDVLLSDIVMPRLSGPELAKMFGQLQPRPVIIFMSGYADDALLSAGMTEGSAFLRKPFSPGTLAHTVRDAIDAAKRTSRAAAAV